MSLCQKHLRFGGSQFEPLNIKEVIAEKQNKQDKASGTIQLYYFAEIAKGSARHNLSSSAIPDSPAAVTSPQERECTPHSQRFRDFQPSAGLPHKSSENPQHFAVCCESDARFAFSTSPSFACCSINYRNCEYHV